MTRLIALMALAALVRGHSDHSFDLDDSADAAMPYAERHMHTEHHIDSFDLESFFKLHDLNMDGYWDEPEIQAVYGLHHHSVKEKIPQPEIIDGRTKMIVDKVLQRLDKNEDGKISQEEFVSAGPEGLPSFEGYKGLGHHYDEESEYFLHHEELYHSSPETQTDDSYTHPEDIEHFRHHQVIEDEEDARERKFEGLAPDADLTQDHVAEDPLEEHAHAEGEGPPGEAEEKQNQKPLKAGDPVPPPPKIERADPNAQPQRLQPSGPVGPSTEDLKRLSEEAKGKAYGSEHGRPRSPEERLRAGVPYKYKFRKGLRADEF